MAVDAVLWLILAVAIGLIACGCIFTARPAKPAKHDAERLGETLDRAA